MLLTIPNARLTLPPASRFAALTLALCCAGFSTPSGLAQTQPPAPAPPPCPAASQPCPAQPATPAPEPSLADRFPFPGNSPGNASAPPDAPRPAEPTSGSRTPATPSAQPAPTKQTAFPFPGEPDSTPATAYSSSASSSSADPDASGDSDTPAPTSPDQPLTRTQRRHLPKVEDLDHREEEDVQVSRYYFSTGDFNAAYLRAKDAVKIIPDDPEAHFALAESAARLKKTDEAIAEYKACLTLDPDGARAKASRRALGTLK